jgi:hypothetical protein
VILPLPCAVKQNVDTWDKMAVVAVTVAGVRAVIDRLAADVDKLARTRRVQNLNTAR